MFHLEGSHALAMERGGMAFACFSTKTRNEGDTEKKGIKIEQRLWMDDVLPPTYAE